MRWFETSPYLPECEGTSVTPKGLKKRCVLSGSSTGIPPVSILWFLVSAHSSQDTSQDTSQDPLLIMRSAAIALALASSASAQQLSPGCAEDMAVILNKSGNISAWNGKLTKGYSATFDARMQQCAASKKPCPASKKRPAGWSCCTVDVKKYYVDHAADVHQLSLALRRTPHSGGTNTSV